MKSAGMILVAGLLGLATAGCMLKSSSSSSGGSGRSDSVGSASQLPGSSSSSQSLGAGSGSSSDVIEMSAGRKIFNSNCTRCHAINGQGGGGPGGGAAGPGGPPGGWGKGPDLGKVGGNRSADWIADHVRDPQSHKPSSRMPKFPEAKISEADLKTLSEYLAGLK